MNGNQNISRNHGEIQQEQHASNTPSPQEQYYTDQFKKAEAANNALENAALATLGITFVVVVICCVSVALGATCFIRARNRPAQGPMGVQQPYDGAAAASQTP